MALPGFQEDSQQGAALNCERLVKIYRIGATDVTALAGLDFRVDAGEMVGMIGPSGCGKSTLMNMLGALAKPTTGTVTVDDVDLGAMTTREADHFRAHQVGFVWQDTARNLVPYLSAAENIALPMTLAGTRSPGRRATVMLKSLGLSDRATHLPHELSGGQQQRVAIGVALANSPRLLLCDEPTGELDGTTAAEIYALLRRVNQTGVTVVVVSHDPNMAAVVDRVVELRDGQSAAEHRGTLEAHPDRAVLLVDTVGRIRVPDEFRQRLGIGERVDVTVEENGLMLRRFDAAMHPKPQAEQ